MTFATAAQAINRLAGTIARREGRTVEIEEIISDEPLSDGRTWVGAEQMIRRVKCGGVDAMVACSLAHLVRSPTKFLAFCEFLASPPASDC